jgi:hypothetical protein
VSDAALRALACLLALRTSGGGGEHLARDAADALDAYADAFASFCDGATAGFRSDASAPRVERAAARGAVPLLFHAVAEAGATATATLRAYACALAAKRCPGFASLEKGARESLAGAAQARERDRRGGGARGGGGGGCHGVRRGEGGGCARGPRGQVDGYSRRKKGSS